MIRIFIYTIMLVLSCQVKADTCILARNIVDEAQQRYSKKHRKPFSLVHSWKLLKNEPMQNGKHMVLRPKKRKTRACMLMLLMEMNHVLSGEKRPRQNARRKRLWMVLLSMEII